MKTSIALSVLILAIGAMFGWQDHRHLSISRATHDKLAAEAAQFGVSIDPKNPADPVRLTKRGDRGGREGKDAEARLVAKELIAFAKEVDALEEKGVRPDEAMQKRKTDFMARIVSLDAAQLKILIAELKVSNDIKDETRQGLIGLSIMTLANDHPQAALTLLIESSTDSSGVLKIDGTGKEAIAASLAKWTQDDPMGALDWVKKSPEKFRALVDDNAKRAMISAVAANDPKLAFQLIGELGLKEDAVRPILDAARTPEGRTATLAAFRAHLASLPEGEAREEASKGGIRSLVVGAVREGFEAGSQWIASAGFTPEQLLSIADGGFLQQSKTGDTGKWVEWMGENLPEGKSNGDIRQMVREMVRHWTAEDYQAAGKWLAATPDGPAKNISVRSYAETVAKYEPQTAAQWAMTLPPGKDRDETLKNIYHVWPKDDEAAKDAFANEHGIK
ncbi:MAG: hypothetical protein V4819_15550 [Verrucomicrobiota bacterium]